MLTNVMYHQKNKFVLKHNLEKIKSYLDILSRHEPDLFLLEVKEICDSIKENKVYEDEPSLTVEELEIILSYVNEDIGVSDILLERSLRREVRNILLQD